MAPARRAEAVAAIAMAAAAPLLVLIVYPRIDLAVSGWFYSPGEGFALAHLPLFVAVLKGLPYPAIGAAVLAVLLAASGLLTRHTWLGATPRVAAYLVTTLALGPGLLVNTLLKDHWGRARPHQIIEFGGSAHFTPVAMVADQCDRNCSFPSGHAALGFWLIAFAFAAPAHWRPVAVAAALLVGSLVGLMRIAQGAHFLSDVLAAALIVVILNLFLKRLILDGTLV